MRRRTAVQLARRGEAWNCGRALIAGQETRKDQGRLLQAKRIARREAHPARRLDHPKTACRVAIWAHQFERGFEVTYNNSVMEARLNSAATSGTPKRTVRPGMRCGVPSRGVLFLLSFHRCLSSKGASPMPAQHFSLQHRACKFSKTCILRAKESPLDFWCEASRHV